jgi:hypothetical protein
MNMKTHKNVFQHFDMHSNDSFKRQKYKANTGNHGIERTGQEKLFYADLMACIAYVCEYDEIPAFVVVAGGAPGVHFIKLAKMLPSTTEWHLYNPEPFACNLELIGNVLFLQEQIKGIIICTFISNCTRMKTAVNGPNSRRPSS